MRNDIFARDNSNDHIEIQVITDTAKSRFYLIAF